MENRVPVIYFLGVAPGRYQAMVPTFMAGWDATGFRARVAFGDPIKRRWTPLRPQSNGVTHYGR